MNAWFHHRLRRAVACTALVLSTAAGCRPSAPSSPSETAAQFYTLLDGLGVSGVPDSLALDAVQPYLDSTLVHLLIEARQARDSVARLVPREEPLFIDGDLFSSLFEGNTSFGIRRLATRGDTTFAVMAFTNAMQPPTVKWTDTLVIVPRPNAKPNSPQFVIADLRYGADWDFGNRGSLMRNLRAALAPDSAPDPDTTVVARDAHRAELGEAISRGLTGRH